MLNSHLLWAPCDTFVYDFLSIFLGIVGGLRATTYMCSYCLQASCHFLYGPSGAGRDKSIQRLHGACTEIVQSQYSCCAVTTASAQKLYRAHAASVQASARRWCGDHAASMTFVSMQPPRCARAGIVQCHLQHVYGLRTYNFFNICITSR